MVGLCVRNQQNIDEHYHCKISALILREPVQLICCGHRFCRSCVESQIQEQIIKCPECHEECNQDEVLLDRGFKNDMKSLIVECSLCEWKDVLMNYKDHLVQSHPNPSCQYCGIKFESTDQLGQHQLSDCEKITIPCALQKYGCSSSVLRVEMAQHYLSQDHQSAIITFIRGVLSKVVPNQAEGGSEMDVDNLPNTTTTSSSIDTNTKLTEVDETVDVLAREVQVLNEDAQRFSSDSVQIQSLLDILTKKPLVQGVGLLKQKIEDSQFVSYDGTYTWKIPNFAKMADAQSERQTSIDSQPFYSSPTGYEMKAHLHPCSDDKTRSSRLSFFITFGLILISGVHDSTLQYPPNYKAGFCIYDQSTAQRHIIDYFQPNITSENVQGTRLEMNLGSSKLISVPLSRFKQDNNPHVQDDTMFIKIMVDFGDMPKNILPYALSLNPGLPTHVVQRMIKEEAERRTQHSPSRRGDQESNQKLSFLCEICFLTGQHDVERFCGHQPKHKWIITQAERIVSSGLHVELSIDTKAQTNGTSAGQRADQQPLNAGETWRAYQPTEIDKY